MGGRDRAGRLPLWLAVVGISAIGAGLLVPAIAGASSPQPATQREQRVSERPVARALSAQLVQAPLPNDLHATVAIQRIVVPVDGGDLAVYGSPGATEPSQVLPAINELDSPLALLTTAAVRDWYQVLLPTRPNGATAWVPASAVSVSVPQHRVEVSLSGYELKVVSIADDAVVMTSPIGIGAPSSPTPSGLFFVRDHFPTEGAGHPYGPFAFGLSGHSDVHTQFGTGDGRIAIHGTNQPSSIGAAVSNGCPHVPNDVVLALIPYLPLGTPVLITP
jgi:lipoprotein-anchoring transpeptidase ErfK/SrfK